MYVYIICIYIYTIIIYIWSYMMYIYVYLNSMHDSGPDSGSRWMFHLNPKVLGRCPKKIYTLSNLRSFLIIFIWCCSRKNNISSPGFTICFPPKKKVNISCHPLSLVAWSMGEGSSRFRLFVELLEARLEETWHWKPGSSQNIIGIIGFICFIYLIFIYLLCILFNIYICLPSLPFLLGVSHILTIGNHCF